jgi:hypothetical protein
MKAPVIIKLNGTIITGEIDGVDNFTITYRQDDEQGVLTKSYSAELTFYGDGYDILKAQLIDDPNGFTNEVSAQVYDECCGRLVFDGVITGGGIDWCEPECWISCQIVETQPELDCVKSTLIYENHNLNDGFLNRQQKKLRYCVEMRPQVIAEILLGLYSIINTAIYIILLPLSLVVVVIQTIGAAVCNIVCAIPFTDCTFGDCADGEWTNPTNAFDEISGWVGDLQDRMIQCQWYHPTALVRDYIKNVCDKCGLSFKSSILNDPSSPYYNLLLFSAPVRKGYRPSETNGLLISENLPIETLDTLMQRHLRPLFNAKYWIINGEFIFERRDYFANTNTWIDAEQLLLNGRILENRICLSWIDEKKYAYGVYEYLQDGSDLLASEAGNRFNTIVEWNNPPSPAQSEFMDNKFLSGMARFRDDFAGFDAIGWAANTPANTAFGNAIADSRTLLLMSQHTAFNYKFLIWDDSSPIDNAIVQRFYSNAFTGGPVIENLYYNYSIAETTIFDQPVPDDALYNYPMWFNENNANNLYSLFHYINNPRVPGAKMYDFSFTFEFDCGEFDSVDFSKNIRLRVGNNIKFGEVKELTVDFLKRTIAVKGIV